MVKIAAEGAEKRVNGIGLGHSSCVPDVPDMHPWGPIHDKYLKRSDSRKKKKNNQHDICIGHVGTRSRKAAHQR